MATFSPWRLLSTPCRTLTRYLQCVIIYSLLALQSSHAAHNELPVLGDSSSGLVSKSQEYLLGRTWLRQLRAQAKIISDPLTTLFIEELIYRLAPHSEVTDSRFEFVVIDGNAIDILWHLALTIKYRFIIRTPMVSIMNNMYILLKFYF